ncbi:restriction endonuclease subunit S [Caulobacter sp. RHG1]|uniref:restriction endonuclease subunit S n=1 Tax=Caulobacter sp. (strain RHG1) TaxID=2545762 RepID=UPI001557E102|nr:restriction endonuclease subunit S [Caulobacter sp. RHG1]NQE64537.1 Type I restriction-modification system, specificity subunit S [Caulobacter sp. RHG1]
MRGDGPVTTNFNVGELTEILSGFAFKSEQFTTEPSEGMPLIRIRDLKSDETVCRYVGDFDPAYIIRKGDIVAGMDGEFLAVRWAGEDALLNQRVLRLKSSRPNVLDNEYLFYRMQPELKRLEQAITGTTVKHLSTKDIKRLVWDLPSLDEQRRIAEVLRSMDAAIATTGSVLSAASAVRQSALDAMMQAIVEADGGDHVLSDVAEVRTGIAKNKNADGRHVQLPYLRVANVQDGWFDLSEMQEIAVEADKVDRYSLKDGDVLLTEGGDYDKLGRGGVWKAQVHPCLHQNHVFCVRSDQMRLLPAFLALVTQSYLGRAYFLSCAKRTTNLASINSSQLKALPVPLPDLERQGAVVEEIGCIDALIEHEQEKLRSLRRLRSSQATELLSGRVRVPT